jgi:hypothetical protein
MKRSPRLIKVLILVIMTVSGLTAQHTTDFGGQLSVLTSFAPDNRADVFLGARFIPEINHEWKVDSSRTLEGEASLYTAGSIFSESLESFDTDGSLDLYRLWVSYRIDRLEVRAGLQKIDFGSAAILRPLQWFNQIDPRDPLQLTNGVYGLLGRYYLKNNANVWLWALYGNDRSRGFDVLGSVNDRPEIGGRFQHPVGTGELAASFHYRQVQSAFSAQFAGEETTPETRYALDGKWDVGIGLWFEAAYIHKHVDAGVLTEQTLLNLGADYTLPIGNGLGIIVEHLLFTFDQEALRFTGKQHVSGTSLSYPVSLFGSLRAVGLYNWGAGEVTMQLIYEHQFPSLTGYVMLFTNPSTQVGIQDNELVNQFAGPGARLMVVKDF